MNKLSDRFNRKNIETDKVVEIDNKNSDIQKALIEKINSTPVWNEYSQEKQQELIKNFVDNKLVCASESDKNETLNSLTKTLTGFGVLQYLLDNENVSAVFVNGINSVYIEINGKILNTETKLSTEELEYLVKMIGTDKDICECRINDYLITLISSDICLSGTNITIRKIKSFNIQSMIDKGLLSKEIYEFLISIINQRKNIVISGEINSGKTTLLNILIENCLHDKRAYIIENIAQITVENEFLVKFNTKNFENLIPVVLKSKPEYIITDLNYFDYRLTDLDGKIVTLRSKSIESSLKTIIASYNNMPDKFAKTKALTDFDYIAHITDQGLSIIELTPAKTMAQSIKTIF